MIRDRFYRDIEQALRGKLDPELFERCAADVLRSIHPTLVPVRGGGDAGRDGAIADQGGLPFPLITTTAEDVARNLRKNLNAYVQGGGARRTVVLATSRVLTPAHRTALERAAADREFTLLQIHDGAAFADLLYRDPAWCRELLGLVGAPPPLSIMPLPTRPLTGDTLIGRAADLEWLRGTGGDLLVVGQPGSGKTFLLYRCAKEAGGLFVLTDDLAEIAAGLRAEQPSVLVVDDAHLRPELLVQLRRLRTEMGAEFRVVADCWPGSRVEVARSMGIATGAVRELELLSRDDIAALVKATGIGGPRELIQEIVNQAEGKPGLAVSLCHVCLRGDVDVLASGDALAEEIASAFRPLIGDDVAPFLAAFSVGGDRGMSLQDVAAYLGVSAPLLRERAAKLAAGGVLLETHEQRLAVRPPVLRFALVRDVFFSGATSLPVEPLITRAPDACELARTVLGAQFRGAAVPDALGRALVEDCSSPHVWALYVRLSRSEAEWVAADHPDVFARVADAALDVAPDTAIPALLQAAVGDERSLNAHPDHALRRLDSWITGARPGSPAVLERRRRLLEAADAWWTAGGDATVALHAFSLSLSPEFSRTDSEPGSGRAVTFSRGVVTLEDAKGIRALWPTVRGRLAGVEPAHWAPLRDLVQAWAAPYHGPYDVPQDLLAAMRSLGAEMLRDVAEIGRSHPGVVKWARSVAEQVSIELPVDWDEVFEVLYPPSDLGDDWRETQAEQARRAGELAKAWTTRDAVVTAAVIRKYEEEGRLGGHPWPRWTPFVCERIAAQVADASAWLAALLDQAVPGDLVQPFLRRLLHDDAGAGGRVARRCLEMPEHRLATAITLLLWDQAPPDLLDAALAHLEGGAKWIGALCLRGDLSESRVRLLLSHPDAEIACAAAVGEWQAEPRGQVRPGLRAEWEQAILRCGPDEWFLREILVAEPTLAVRWLPRILQEGRWLWRHEETVAAALKGLDVEGRRQLLATIPADVSEPEAVRALIGDDLGLYRELLGTARLGRLHLHPLTGHPILGPWAAMALLALDVGYSADVIVEAAFGHQWSWMGEESAMWDQWARRFDELTAHPDARIQQIGALGREEAQRRRDRAKREEREEQVRGE